MNTLQDLRATLDQHAAEVGDDSASARVAAVHSRARVVRRRRAAGVGAAAVLTVVAATGVPWLLGDRSPAPVDRELIGKVAPATLTSLGYTYAFAEGVESGDRPASVRLRPSDEPRLVTWAADADELVVQSTVEGRVTISGGTDFDDFALVPASESGRWTVRAGGADAAIAVYELTDDRPAGYTAGGITFREQVADQVLQGAVVGDVGDTDVTLEVEVPASKLFLADLCRMVTTGASFPDGLIVNVEIDDRGTIGTGGCSDDALDLGGRSGGWYDNGDLGAGSTVAVRTWVSRRLGGEPVDLPGVRLGLAAYEVPEPAVEAGSWDLPGVYEYDGHLWEFVGSAGGSLPGTVGGTAPDGAGLALVSVDVRRGLSYELRVAGETLGRTTTAGASQDSAVVEPGEQVSVRPFGPRRGEVAIGFYQRVD